MVSVIIPCFNAGKYIEKTLLSITEQTYQNLEIILVDDGNENPLLKSLPEKFKQDKRLVIVRHDKNRGFQIHEIPDLKKQMANMFSSGMRMIFLPVMQFKRLSSLRKKATLTW